MAWPLESSPRMSTKLSMSANIWMPGPALSTCKYIVGDSFTLSISTNSRYNKTDVAAPFGGFKESGFGKDLGREALNEYMKTKTITFEYSI